MEQVCGGKGGWRINGRTVKFWCNDNGQKTDGFRVVVDIAMSYALSNNMRVEFEFRRTEIPFG